LYYSCVAAGNSWTTAVPERYFTVDEAFRSLKEMVVLSRFEMEFAAA
jgi:hypothetical protein